MRFLKQLAMYLHINERNRPFLETTVTSLNLHFFNTYLHIQRTQGNTTIHLSVCKSNIYRYYLSQGSYVFTQVSFILLVFVGVSAGLHKTYWTDFHKTWTEDGCQPRIDPFKKLLQIQIKGQFQDSFVTSWLFLLFFFFFCILMKISGVFSCLVIMSECNLMRLRGVVSLNSG